MGARPVRYSWDHQCESCSRVHVPDPCCGGCSCLSGQWWAQLNGPAGAWESTDGSQRYLLWRAFNPLVVDERKPLGFCMLNPSTAGATMNDPTVRRCCGFGLSEGASGVIVGNLTPLRGTDPKKLDWNRASACAQTQEQIDALDTLFSLCSRVVLAWGAGIRPTLDRSAGCVRRLARAKSGLWCLGTTKRGEPRHPLMVRGSQAVVELGCSAPGFGADAMMRR